MQLHIIVLHYEQQTYNLFIILFISEHYLLFKNYC